MPKPSSTEARVHLAGQLALHNLKSLTSWCAVVASVNFVPCKPNIL